MGESNSKSIAALTFGILSIVMPFVGLILGIIGIIISRKSITEIAASSEKGRGLAISGKVCSIVGICIQILYILLGILGFVFLYAVEIK